MDEISVELDSLLAFKRINVVKVASLNAPYYKGRKNVSMVSWVGRRR